MDIKGSAPLTDINEASQATVKYKKALKQINRLIGINTTVKKQLIKVQEQYDILRGKYNELQEKYTTLEEEMSQITHNNALPNLAKVAMSYEEQLSSKASQLRQEPKTNLLSSQRRGKEDLSPVSNRGKELENTGTLSEYMDTKRKLQQVQQRLNEKQKQIVQMNVQLQEKNRYNAELYEKYIEISNSLTKMQNQTEIKGQITGVEQLLKQKTSLQGLLASEKQLSAKLIKENQNLRKNSGLKLGASQQSMISNPKSLDAFTYISENKNFGLGSIPGIQSRPPAVPYHQSFYSSAQHSLQNSQQKLQKTDPFSQYYFKKVRDLQSQIQITKKEYSQKKSKYRNQISKLKDQLSQKDQQIKQINDFIVKQQAFIESFYQKKEIQERSVKSVPKMVVSSVEYQRPQQKASHEKKFEDYGIAYNEPGFTKDKISYKHHFMGDEKYCRN